MTASPGHIATRQVQAPADVAFRYLSDPLALGRWSLGCFDTRPAEEPGLYAGRSLIDGSDAFFRIDADPERLVVDYLVGTPDSLVRRISARVVPGPTIDLPEAFCLVSLMAWRTAGMDDEHWARLCALHEAEIVLIKGQIEHGAASE